MLPFTIRKATTNDAAAIATILTSDKTSSFLRLQLGTGDPAVLNDGLTNRMTKSILESRQLYIVACDDEVISYAPWTLPRDEFKTIVEQTLEVISFKCITVNKTTDDSTIGESQRDGDYRNELLPSINKTIIMDFRRKLRVLGEIILKRRR